MKVYKFRFDALVKLYSTLMLSLHGFEWGKLKLSKLSFNFKTLSYGVSSKPDA